MRHNVTTLHAEGFLTRNKTPERQVVINRLDVGGFDGYILNEIQMHVILTSEMDIDKLIKMLDTARYCFRHPLQTKS